MPDSFNKREGNVRLVVEMGNSIHLVTCFPHHRAIRKISIYSIIVKKKKDNSVIVERFQYFEVEYMYMFNPWS